MKKTTANQIIQACENAIEAIDALAFSGLSVKDKKAISVLEAIRDRASDVAREINSIP